jgi:predicted enzyme related to lactoylglutathione lyase
VDDADTSAARVKDLGGTVLAEPFDVPWQRLTVIRDPQGAHLTLSQFKPPE